MPPADDVAPATSPGSAARAAAPPTGHVTPATSLGSAARAAAPPTGHVIVCGVDHLGVRTVEELRLRHESVVVVAPPSAEPAADLGLADVPVVVGDCRLERVLREAGLEGAGSIVLTSDDDLGNLEAAMAAYAIKPAIRIVVRMFDVQLGAHLEDLFENAVVLSSSAVAAPGFVSAAIDGEGGEQFELAGRILTARAVPTDGLPPDTARTDVEFVPIARLGKDRSVELLPDADPAKPGLIVVEVAERLATGGRGSLRTSGRGRVPTPPIGLARAARTVGAEESTASGRRAAAVRRARSVPRTVRDSLASPERRLLKFATILIALAVVSMIFFELTAGLTPLEALSFAITLLTGASLPTSIDPESASIALRIYAILLSIVGAALVAVVYALITDAIIRSRLLQTLGRRSVPARIRDHVIVCGLGSIGYRVALGIAELGVPVVAVELREDGRFVAAARAVGIPVITGDARQREILDQAGLRSAAALVAATSDDLVNLSAALNARAIDDDLRVVVRLFDPDFAVRVQKGFKIRFTRSVSHLAAPAFAAAAIGSEVVATIPVGDRRVVLFARLWVPRGSSLDGRLVGSLGRVGRRRILALTDADGDEPRWHPDPDRRLKPGDELVVVATRAGLADLLDLSRPTSVQRRAAQAGPATG